MNKADCEALGGEYGANEDNKIYNVIGFCHHYYKDICHIKVTDAIEQIVLKYRRADAKRNLTQVEKCDGLFDVVGRK